MFPHVGQLSWGSDTTTTLSRTPSALHTRSSFDIADNEVTTAGTHSLGVNRAGIHKLTESRCKTGARWLLSEDHFRNAKFTVVRPNRWIQKKKDRARTREEDEGRGQQCKAAASCSFIEHVI